MRAVNLIPVDERRGPGSAGRSGGAVYGVLGALVVAVVALTAYVLVSNSVNDRRADLGRVTQEATAAEAQAAALRPYREFAALKAVRVATVSRLASSRFDWEGSMRELARVVPGNVWLTSFVGTVAPGISPGESGSGGDTGTLRASTPVPAVELIGCTTSQDEVSRLMSRLRQVDGVTRVSLASSEKGESEGGGAGPASGGSGQGGSGDCRNGSSRYPQFQVVIFFGAEAEGGPPPTGAPGGGAGAAPSPAAPASSASPPAGQP